ncbi:MAG: alanine racemase [Lachnospiraceae bacterium]|nr:alanine racemase [Lachnospiraceae bacterium]
MSKKRVYAEISLGAIRENMENMHSLLDEKTKMIAVIKANGYGHGALKIAECLEDTGYVFGYATATAEEAFRLRDNGIRKAILILGYTFPENYEEMIAEDIRPSVFKYETAKQLNDTAKKLGKTAKIHIKIDTGMSRIGFMPDDKGLSEIKRISELENIETEGIFTHFARADEKDKSNALGQLGSFLAFADRCEKNGIRFRYRHASNSAAILELKEANLDIVRAGITVYGLWPSEEMDRQRISLKPAMTLKSSIVYIKDLPEGIPVSYGGTFITKKATRVATIPVGYADGYPRSLSNKGYVLIRGKRAGILGRVCMDQMMVDVTDIPEASEYDEAVLLGRQGDEIITAEDIGDMSGRFNYEFVCDISERVPRVYKY